MIVRDILHTFETSSLRTQLIAAFVFVIIITISLLSIVNYYKWKKDFFAMVREEGIVLTQTLAQGSISPILVNDFFTLEEYITMLLKKEDIAYVVISDRHDNFLAQSDSAKFIPSDILDNGTRNTAPVLVQTYRNKSLKVDINDISVPIMIESGKWGVVRVGFSLNFLEKEIYKNISLTLIIGFISIVVGIIVALLLMRLVTKPVNAFIKSMQLISDGNLHEKINLNTSYEFAIMAESFNSMAKSLQESKEELKTTYAELSQQHKLSALGEFAARVAHEIKNPLGIIKSSAQIVLGNRATPDIKEEVGKYIIEEIDRLNTKVQNILDYARPRTMNLVPTDINETINKSLYFGIAQQLDGNQITVHKKLGDNIPLINLDTEMIHQAFLNLFINSSQAMDGKGTIDIITAFNIKGWVEIIFKDYGKGIPEELLDKIFDPFFTTKNGGTGLGLSIVLQTIESHNGKIDVTSAINSGTQIKIILPVQ
jgi:signal transduction histidine kinase